MSLDLRLVLTPFLPVHQPALGVSSLLSVARTHGYTGDVLYLNLDFMQRFDEQVSVFIAKFSQLSLLGDVLFARALWGDAAPPWTDYIRALHTSLEKQQASVVTVGYWKDIRQLLDRYTPRFEEVYEAGPEVVAGWAERVLDGGPKVVGFSTTFQQNIASLALAAAVRRRAPGVRIVLGGANCEGDMGRTLARCFPFVDHVVSGEAEAILPGLLAAWTGRAPTASPPPRYIQGTNIEDLDELPIPDFGDYFRTLAAEPGARAAWAGSATQDPNLSAESSRGCWWGAKAHCKFCGLNGTSMAFRRKSPERVRTELAQLAETYGVRRFMMTDNILDMGYFGTLLPALVGQGYELFYETKANLRREQVASLAQAGIRWLQPGIESLETEVLRLMDKGCTLLQNVQLLRWSLEYRIEPFWSVLYGFPGETREGHGRTAALMPALVHLPPPMQVTPFHMQRFSPYFFDAGKHGLTGVRPAWMYRYAYPGLSDADLAGLAYTFEYDDPRSVVDSAEAGDMRAAARAWMVAHREGARLALLRMSGGVQVFDSRFERRGVLTPLSPAAARVLSLVDSAASSGAIERGFAAEGLATDGVAATLQWLVEQRFVLQEGSSFVSLVVDHSRALHSRTATWRAETLT